MYTYEYLASMCLRNLTTQLKANPAEFTRLDGEFYLSNETEAGRSKWIHTKDSNKEWFYRRDWNNDTGTVKYFDSWIYSDNGDRVACGPGYVDSPLFCTLFIYAGWYPNGTALNTQYQLGVNIGLPPHRGGITTWKMGGCDDNILPTFEPTLPTLEPSPSPSILIQELPTDTDNGESQSSISNNEDSGLIASNVSLAVLWFLTFICCGFFVWKYIKNRNGQKQDVNESIMKSIADNNKQNEAKHAVTAGPEIGNTNGMVEMINDNLKQINDDVYNVAQNMDIAQAPNVYNMDQRENIVQKRAILGNEGGNNGDNTPYI